MMKRRSLLFFLFILSLFLSFPESNVVAAEQGSTEVVSLDGVAPDQVDSLLAKMSDEQVRSLLVSELAKDFDKNDTQPKVTGGFVVKAKGLLHVLDDNDPQNENTIPLLSVIKNIPVSFIAVARKIGGGSMMGFFVSLALLTIVFTTAYLTEFFGRRFTANFSRQFQEKAIPDLDGPMRFVAGIMRSIPAFIHILVFSGAAVLFFFLLPVGDLAGRRYLFLTVLFIIIFTRSLSQLSKIFCSPESPALRVLPIDDAIAKGIHKTLLLFGTYFFAIIMSLALLLELQLDKNSFAFTVIVFASILILIILSMILRSRAFVRDRILQKSEFNQTRNWVVEQFAAFWHVPTILYFIIIWMVLVGDQLAGVQRENAAFLLSLLILPLYILFNGVGQWVVRVSINTLKIYNPDGEESADDDLKVTLAAAKEHERKLSVTAGRFMSLGILGTLLVWVLSLWGVDIPYATNITGAVFQSLTTLALALMVWRFVSSYIEKKIEDATPEEEEDKSNDDEMGGATTRGRSYTLLPMLRKFIASTLLVMVTLVILSSMGIDIGPLLAGAGVIGLAIGFGAQKLVSDVFSGFFYLFDDAFRVGEYIQAGSVSGAVESITLRNVMLRHHRGMLQIVPHSELGSITNFMRGGIIVKFNLEFPYDANVDKIRKIIKKVGQAMLKDEEFGDDFISPVKSAGVREITASVMVIRVKFKAQPGTQFVIRREAYRRITDALAAQGIHYAHRKVIVELPEQGSNPIDQQQLLEAGAAAALTQQEEDDKKKAEGA